MGGWQEQEWTESGRLGSPQWLAMAHEGFTQNAAHTAERVRPKGAEMNQRGQQVTGMTLEGGSEVRTEPQRWRGRAGRETGKRQRPVGVGAGGDSRGAPGSWGGSWPVRWACL